MFRTALFGLVSAAALISSANAADLGASSYKDGSYGPTWAGVYVGINGGYGLSANNSTIYAYANDPGVGATTTSATTDYDKSGGFGGGQIGYNFQRGRVRVRSVPHRSLLDIRRARASVGAVPHSLVPVELHQAPLETRNLDGQFAPALFVTLTTRRSRFISPPFAYGGTHGIASMAMNDNAAHMAYN